MYYIRILAGFFFVSMLLLNCSGKGYSGSGAKDPNGSGDPGTNPGPTPTPTTTNVAPVAGSVAITETLPGHTHAGDILTGQYLYNDADGDAEGISIFRWLRDGVPIVNGNSNEYIVKNEDIGKMISFEVTPVAVSGELQGLPVQSANTIAVLKPVAVVFVIDTSASMFTEVQSFVGYINEFATQFSASFIDMSTFIIADASVACVPLPLGGNVCGADHAPLYYSLNTPVINGAIFSGILNNAGLITDKLPVASEVHIVAVTDSNDVSITASDFAAQLLTLSPQLAAAKFHAIVANADSDPACIAIGALRPVEVIGYGAGKAGVLRDICQQNIPTDLDEIINEIKLPGDGKSNVTP